MLEKFHSTKSCVQKVVLEPTKWAPKRKFAEFFPAQSRGCLHLYSPWIPVLFFLATGNLLEKKPIRSGKKIYDDLLKN